MRKILKGIFYTAIYYLAVDQIVFYSFVIRARMSLGYWPSYDRPDPQDLGFTGHYNLCNQAFEPLPYCFGIVVAYGIVCLFKRQNLLRIHSIHFFLFGGLLLIEATTIFGPFFEWFTD